MASAADNAGAWLIPSLSLPTQLEMEMDRRAAARMSRDQLSIKCDELIQTWYQQNDVINKLLGRVRQLEVEVILASDPKPSPSQPSPEHYKWAEGLTASTQKPNTN